jgi:release factor glutamine methyltransferase
MVEWSIDNLAPRTNCIDVGTGSGCLAISLKLARSDIHMIASDISDEALAVARHNAKALAADVTFIQSDLFEKIDQRFSLVMANLPYVPISYKVSPEVLKEPKLAVYSKADGLEHYRRLAAQLPSVLDKPAFLLLEHSPEQFEQLKAIFEPLTKQVQSISNFTALFTIQ